MGWFNWYGLIIIAVIFIPNILCAVLDKNAFVNKFSNKFLTVTEQIGRYGCMAFMVFNIPYTYFNFWFSCAIYVYFAVNGFLLVFYCLGWIIFRKSRSIIKALWLSVTPSLIFVFSGIMLASVPLLVCAVIFSVAHILISVKNAEPDKE